MLSEQNHDLPIVNAASYRHLLETSAARLIQQGDLFCF
jgi:hypothetical protein